MKRNTPHFKKQCAKPLGRLPDPVDAALKAESSKQTPDLPESGRVSSVDLWRSALDQDINEMFSSGLHMQDKELACLLAEMDKISKTLKSTAPDPETLSNALQLAVLCTVKQSLLERELRSLALTDDLTGLYNRRAFLALATQQMRIARRNSQGLQLFFVDVDHLKEINDSLGHREGDYVLIRTADALEQSFRGSDIIARIGGDEFAVLALEASSQSQQTMLKRLEDRVNKSNLSESRSELSLSVGVTKFDPHNPTSLGELLARADQAMYEEKRNHPSHTASK